MVTLLFITNQFKYAIQYKGMTNVQETNLKGFARGLENPKFKN